MKQDLSALEEETFYEDDNAHVPPPDIVAYNELRSCADLFRMHEQGILDIQPDFQRDVVWKGPAQTRFIDSLVKQLPIPSMCFALDHAKQKWIVIDGLQRIATIVKFLKGADWTLSSLDDVDQGLAGKSVTLIKDRTSSLHHYYTRVENLSVPVTVLRCDFDKRNHMEYLFTIFHRLNTGGMKLNNQEIRNCIYGGPFNELLRSLDRHPNWRRLNRMKAGELYRLTKQELILRFLAFADGYESYQGHLAKFLNEYMSDHRTEDQTFLSGKTAFFEATVDMVFKQMLSGRPPKNRIATTVLEAVLVGVGRNLAELSTQDKPTLKRRLTKMLKDGAFDESALTEGLSKRPKVIERLNRAVAIFAGAD